MKIQQTILASVFAVMTFPTFAQLPMNQQKLIVVEDLGGVSAIPYYEEIGLTPETVVTSTAAKPQTGQPVSVESMLPVRSEHLSPGIVSARAIQAPGLRPIFIIGDDKLSQQWLNERRDALIQLNAVGLVVNVETLEELKRLQDIVPELMMTPVSGDDIAYRLGLQHYPVLITSTAIEQ